MIFQLFKENAGIPHILVIGDLMIDHYIWGKVERISPEAPVAVVEVYKESRCLGGACNVMHNLLALGAKVIPCGVIGQDRTGEEVKEKLQELHLNLQGIITQSNRTTTQKSRIIASSQQIVRVDWEQKQDIDAQTEKQILEFALCWLEKVDLIILSDYAKGVLTKTFTQSIIAHAKKHHKAILVDPKGQDYSKYKGATLLTPNKKEAQQATGIQIVDDVALQQALYRLQESCELTYPLITLSEDGIGILHNNQAQKIPTIAREVYDVTGAGDTVIASLGFALSLQIPIIKAAEFANAAAAVVVSKIGSATANLEEIEHFCNTQSSQTRQKILSLQQLEWVLKILREENKRIVWTNGCFDILHYGHVSYLQEAKKLGDVLIVGINTDSSIKQLKGESRPINPLEARAGVLSGLESVDYIIAFDSLTPLELIKIVQPNILVKGGDYEGKEIVGSEFAKKVQTIPLTQNYSTSKIIESIKQKP